MLVVYCFVKRKSEEMLKQGGKKPFQLVIEARVTAELSLFIYYIGHLFHDIQPSGHL